LLVWPFFFTKDRGEMFEDFEHSSVDTGEAAIRVRNGGSGPLLLLRDHPRTHVMWHKIAPCLAEDFTVIATDGILTLARIP
jgi:haloacetate dehalogenase